MRFILLTLICLIAGFSYAQEAEVYTVVEDMPRFYGEACEALETKKDKEQCAQDKLFEYLSTINYPAKAIKKEKSGKVYVRFVVYEDGSIQDCEIAKSSGEKLLDEVAIKHVKAMPNFVPGKQRGKPCRVQYILPINFSL